MACSRTQEDPSLQPCVSSSGTSSCRGEGGVSGSCPMRARVQVPGQLVPSSHGTRPRGTPGAGSGRLPCLAERVKDGEVSLRKALIFLSLLYAFY